MVDHRPGSGGSITVYPGDTLYSLAFAYGVTPEALQRANGRYKLSTRPLPSGAQLRLPGAGVRDAPWKHLDSQQRRGKPLLGVLPVAVGFAVAVVVGASQLGNNPELDFHARRLAKDAAGAGAVGWFHLKRLATVFGGNISGVWHRLLHRDNSHTAPASSTSVATLRAELAHAKADTAAAKALAAAADARSEALHRELTEALAQIEQLVESENAQRRTAEAMSARVQDLGRQLTAIRQAAGEE